ncbi:type II toxin-antitoxin system RelE/ParE family toxin [soil metagenome]
MEEDAAIPFAVNTSAEFDRWWEECGETLQDAIAAYVGLLEEVGPNLGRPYADTLRGSTITNLKELRVQHQGQPYRILFAFDSKREALLLLGGNKASDRRWYRQAIPRAEAIFARHLAELEDYDG